jgi:hypothetical protein
MVKALGCCQLTPEFILLSFTLFFYKLSNLQKETQRWVHLKAKTQDKGKLQFLHWSA